MLHEIADGDRRILPFNVPPSRRTVRTLSEASPLGTVLLFTGVRYSRLVDEIPETSPGEDAPAGQRIDN